MSSVYIFIALTALTFAATRLILVILRKKAILDQPNERSSHTIPTPRGGGLGILTILIPAFGLIIAASPMPPAGSVFVLGGLIALALISWIDDLKNLGPASRFLTQIVCVVTTLTYMPFSEDGITQGFLPVLAEKTLLGLAWLWFINLFNFMDGIDGISGCEVLSINGGILALGFFMPLALPFHFLSVTLAACAVGFLFLNWHKAKIFMGDVGSIPLGFVIGWMLISLADAGYWAAALILPLYYLMDATYTLFNRARRGEKVWQAHREHFYQKAHQSGLRHDQIVIAIGLLNLTLIGCAVLSLTDPITALFVAPIATSVLLWRFNHRYKNRQETA